MQSSNILPLNKSDVFPSKPKDQALFSFMIVGLTVGFFWEVFVVIPNYYPILSPNALFHISVLVFCLFNIFGNLYFLMKVDASGKQLDLPAILKEGWQYCHICQLNSPPRSYHCPLCNKCILKRDHHCKFSGCCVGYYNQRYFIMMILFIWFGVLYGVAYHWNYCIEVVGGSNFSTFVKLVVPHVSVVLGYLSIKGFIAATLNAFGLASIAMTTYLLFVQFQNICYGQTQYEKKHSVDTYNLGFKYNLLDTLGTNWYLVWIAAFLPSPLKGNGLQFYKKGQLEDIKDI